MNEYRCGKCGTSTNERKMVVITGAIGDEAGMVTVKCQGDNCGNEATSMSLLDALALISKPPEEKPDAP